MKKIIRDVLEVVVSVAIITFILIKFILIPCVVEGTSMYPTLKDGDFGYSFVISKNININRFDICVISFEDSDKKLVKRVIGLPNETIVYRNNQLYVDGELVEETFLEDDVYTEDFEVTLGEDEYYCLGDNREVSRDSRYYGPFHIDQFESTHFFCLLPISDFGFKN